MRHHALEAGCFVVNATRWLTEEQGQCELHDDDIWHQRMKDVGLGALGMHLEVVTPEVRVRIMPDKATVPPEKYVSSFEPAVKVFGRAQAPTYILAGLGDTCEAMAAVKSGEIDLPMAPNVLQQYGQGTIDIIAVLSTERHPKAPDVPTAAEAGWMSRW